MGGRRTATIIGGPRDGEVVEFAGLCVMFPIAVTRPVEPRETEDIRKYIHGTPQYFEELRKSFRYVTVAPEETPDGLVLRWPE